MRKFYIADIHFGHANIIRLCNRPFSSVNEMNQVIIQNWNNRVLNDDIVYIIGDISFRCNTKESISMIASLKGKKVLITGNHDITNLKNPEFRTCFSEIVDMKTIFDESVQKKVVLCHYPIVEWDGYFKGNYLVYGHIHNNISNYAYKCMSLLDTALNAGVDINNFMPVTMKELIENNNRFKKFNNI